MDANEIKKIAFNLYPYLYPDGEHTVEAEPIIERIKRIRKGFLPETEFFAIASWLGKCAAIYPIKQTELPISDYVSEFRAPDYLVFAKYKDKTVPILIEVKTKDENKLEWSEKYLTSLKNFAELLKLPLLVAWKWNGTWLLIDHSHFQKKVTAYHLDLATAFNENLMGLIFQDVMVKFNEDISFVLDAEILNIPLDNPYEILPAGEYKMQIKGAAFYEGENRIEISEMIPECFVTFLTIPVDNEVQMVSEHKVKIIYQPNSEDLIHLYHILLSQFYVQVTPDENIDWDKILRDGPFQSSGEEFRKTFRTKESLKFVTHTFQQIPQTIPEYLK